MRNQEIIDEMLRPIQAAAKRLYSEERMNADEMRDMAHRLDLACVALRVVLTHQEGEKDGG